MRILRDDQFSHSHLRAVALIAIAAVLVTLAHSGPASPDGTLAPEGLMMSRVEQKLDLILDALEGLQEENLRLTSEVVALRPLRSEINALRTALDPDRMPSTRFDVSQLPPPVRGQSINDSNPAPQTVASDRPAEPQGQQDILWRVPDQADRSNSRKFSLLGLNLGPDRSGDLTFSGKGRFFAALSEHQAVQIQGGYQYYRQHQEGQFDVGLVNRIKDLQLALFSSLKYLNLPDLQHGATLAQGALTVDYVLPSARFGIFGTKSLRENVVVNRLELRRNYIRESYVDVIDQVGVSGQAALFGDSYLEGNVAYLNASGRDNGVGGTVRLVHPLTSQWALTAEGGWNETLLSKENSGRFAVGIELGHWLRPKEFSAFDHPVPADVPNVRYEVLTRDVRVGNDLPTADAGPDQIDIAPGEVRLDGSASYDSDDDPVSFLWTQTAGPDVVLTAADEPVTTFVAAEGQTYQFRLEVSDLGGSSFDEVTVSTRHGSSVEIVRFSASPDQIQRGEQTTLSWRILAAEEVVITADPPDPTLGGELYSCRACASTEQSTITVSPDQSTSYTVVARNDAGEDQVFVTVRVEGLTVRIFNFVASPDIVNQGEPALLSWTTENADEISISSDPLDETLPQIASGDSSVAVRPVQTTKYRLTASNRLSAESVTADATVTVSQPQPRIVQFTASPLEILSGETTELTWEVQNASTVTISGLGRVDNAGTREVSPEQSTVYTLTAENERGDAVQQSVTVTVSQLRPRIVQFTASPLEILSGETTELTWEVQNASTVTISGLGRVDGAGTREVSPEQSTVYTLTAENERGDAAQQSVVVTVHRPVQIHNFTATPQNGVEGQTAEIGSPGERITLRWKTSNALRVTITGVGPISEADLDAGQLDVFPTGNIAYTLLAYGFNSETSAVVVVHVADPMNRKPVADAGEDFTTMSNRITLDGSGSYDPDGDAITYHWRVVAPNLEALIENPESAITAVQLGGPMMGVYVFELTVIDEKGAICIDTVQVMVNMD